MPTEPKQKKPKADPLFSEGARYDRAIIHKYLMRLAAHPPKNVEAAALLDRIIKWLAGMRARYDKKPGGLGK